MNRVIKIEELVEWILENRIKGVFSGHPDGIALQVKKSVDQNVFCYSFDSEERLNGVVVGEHTHDGEIWIKDILITDSSVLKKFMKHYINLYPDKKIVGTCRGRVRIFNDPKKLLRRIK
jgi:hypothetical protein